MSLLNKIKCLFYALLYLAICFGQDAISQTNDSLKIDTNGHHPFNSFDVHVGWGSQKNIFTGVQLATVPLLFRGDIGFNSHSITGSFVAGWIPGATKGGAEISSILFSLIATLQIDSYSNFPTPEIYTLNIGWISQRNKAFDYTFSAGAGMKIVTSLRKATLFLGIDFSVGYKFY